MKVIIVGGVAGGATAAARIRRKSEEAEIILIEKGKYISYANCGLPYYIGDVIEDRDRLFVQTPEKFGNRFNIDVRIQSEVLSINREEKNIIIKGPNGEEYKEEYDKLLLSTGATPVKPPLPGINEEGIFTLRNVDDTDQIKAYTHQRKIESAVVIGAGFIGLEMAENLHLLGANVSIVEMDKQVMAPIDFSMASLVHQHLIEKEINLYLGETVTGFERDEKGLLVTLKSGKKIPADLVILSIGVRPLNDLAKNANLELGARGGIKVDQYLKTNDPHIYAIGDVIEFPHPLTGNPWMNYLAGPANRQGRIVADNILGDHISYEGSIGTSIAKVFDYTVAATGLPAKRLKAENIAYQSVTTHGFSNATYYPGATPLTIKLTFCPQTGQLYGGQIVGYTGVDKRIDQLALLIKKKGTIQDLIELEHAYAPPFSSAKDPIAIAAYTANNILIGDLKPAYWREIRDANKEDIVLLDVCTPEEFSVKSLPGAINVPLDGMRDNLDKIPKDKPVYLFCAVGLRGYLAYRVLAQHGFTNVKSLIGGTRILLAATTDTTPKNRATENENYHSKEIVSPQQSLPVTPEKVVKVDACGLQCPGPILTLKNAVEELNTGEFLEITSTDSAFPRDAESWCRSTGNTFISKNSSNGKFSLLIQKGGGAVKENATLPSTGKTFILFSDDLDKALATFILANGAAATGQKVTIFFTFWGLNVIKKSNPPKVNKDIFGKLFSMMLPKNSKHLGLSKMNMLGIGSRMMRKIMKHKGVDSLESLRRQALMNGVEFIACQMSMDVMGVAPEELMSEVTLGGVATYMERADQANGNLFI